MNTYQIQIASPEDYDNFKLIPTNRNVNTSHVKKIKSHMRSVGYLGAHPIIVTEDPESHGYLILDGQHRYTAARQLNINFIFTVVDESSYDYKQMNRLSKSWTLLDEIESFAAEGLWDYKILLDAITEEQIPAKPAVCSLTNISSNPTGQYAKIRKGTFKIKPENVYHQYLEFHKLYTKLRVQRPESTWQVGYIEALLCPEFDHDKFIKKVQLPSAGKFMDRQFSDKRFVFSTIDDVYNARERDKVLISTIIQHTTRTREINKKQ